MSILLKTQKMLWGRAASRCCICRKDLVMDASETDDESLVGEACHIVGRKNDGPRGISDLPEVDRDKYSNLLLLCNVHHKLVDDQTNKYTVEKLSEIKSKHISWVKEKLDTYDEGKQRDDEIYADYIDMWEEKLQIDEWKIWATSILFYGQPSLRIDMDNRLSELKEFLLSRVWPQRYKELEEAFHNFRIVLQDFHCVFHEHAIKRGENKLETEKFYKIKEWNEEKYRDLAKEFHIHVALVQDLILELTRAANYVCDKIRECLLRSYRLKEGVLLIDSGPHMGFEIRTYRAEYRDKERVLRPYPGLQEFEEVRLVRDFCFGKQ